MYLIFKLLKFIIEDERLIDHETVRTTISNFIKGRENQNALSEVNALFFLFKYSE